MAEIDCQHARRLIDVALDGEAGEAAHTELAGHVSACPACRTAFAAHRDISRRVRAAASRPTAPPDFRARLLAALPHDEPARPPRVPWWSVGAWGASAAALAASLALTILAPAPQVSVTEDLVAAHVRSLMADHLTDVRSSDRHTVKPWFNGRADLSPPVPDLADQGFPLQGGRLDYVEGRRTAALVYGRRQHVLNLFAWVESGPDRPQTHSEIHGYTALAWRRDGIAYAVVSDLNRREMEEFARAWTARAAEGNGG